MPIPVFTLKRIPCAVHGMQISFCFSAFITDFARWIITAIHGTRKQLSFFILSVVLSCTSLCCFCTVDTLLRIKCHIFVYLLCQSPGAKCKGFAPDTGDHCPQASLEFALHNGQNLCGPPDGRSLPSHLRYFPYFLRHLPNRDTA